MFRACAVRSWTRSSLSRLFEKTACVIGERTGSSYGLPRMRPVCGAAGETAARMPSIDNVDVILRDGGTLRLRPPGQSDAGELAAFFGRLSQRSLYLRFPG